MTKRKNMADMSNGIRNLTKWLNEEQEAPIDRQALARVLTMAEQPAQQEPVAWMWRCKPYCGWPEWSVSLKRPADSGRDGHRRTEGYEDVALYTSPPYEATPLAQRKPLTDEQIWKDDVIMAANSGYGANFETLRELIRAIEAAHGIKGDA